MRIRPVDPPYDEKLMKWMPPGSGQELLVLFRTFGVHPELASRMRPLGAALLGHPTVTPGEREAAILRRMADAEAGHRERLEQRMRALGIELPDPGGVRLPLWLRLQARIAPIDRLLAPDQVPRLNPAQLALQWN